MKKQWSVQARDMAELRKRYDIVCDKWTRTDLKFTRATEISVPEGENDRKRLESQIQGLESQIVYIRNQLGLERDFVQRLTLRRELKAKELQWHLDKQAQELSTTRKSLARAETSKSHLEEKVSDLSRQLQGNNSEEKLAVYERRGPIASSSAMAVDRLKIMEVDLENARKHVAQFQEISQASEVALALLGPTHDEYTASSTEATLSKQAANLEAVKRQLEELKKMLADAKRVADKEREAWRDDKKMSDTMIVDLAPSEKDIAEDKPLRDSDIRLQEECAKAAEERHNREARWESLRHRVSSISHAKGGEMPTIFSRGNVNITDSDGDTPLYTVENVETARWLVDHGAIVDRRNAEGVSPAEHLSEDFPNVSTYLNSLLPTTTTLTSSSTSPTNTTSTALPTHPHPHPLPSQHAQNAASEALTSSLLSDAQAIMERAEREGREGDEGVDEELRAVVSRAVGRGLLRGLEMGEGMDVDEADGEGGGQGGQGRRRGGGQGGGEEGGERGEKRSRMDE
ncbi:uncharacterized protein STEHIDRAFT_152973 [Stereum hirsutum FP-91666 SS1]|uniref:uncharacterized protein n=1 Tax=Stereum hirsutum (strain FP-91666) TaxID=721885 RepID=UPI0004409F05|nr:uncharacterized protein STEHIDRAFT_152973 [Stereum hirsutum FP-91666 SS1]EIM91325.1 hypothetical protein STEHIDRAFT_152973 [Stereum hirsutum FP-91666 SS1]